MYKTDDQQNLLNSIGNYTQYLVITYNGEESKKEYMYMCVYIYIYNYIHTQIYVFE